jgi:dihydroorotase
MYHKVGLSSVSLGEPGYEERETIVNGLSVAAKVALRLLLCNPTFPIVDNQAQVNFVE